MKAIKKPLKLAIQTYCSFLAAGLPFAALAQNETPSENKVEEEIIVTGTLIKGVNLDGAYQAASIDQQAIKESAASNISHLLKDSSLTGGGSGTFSTSTSGPLSGQTPVGAAGVSLRGLGTSSTLTLVNGRRVSVSAFANGQESFIDLNSIPFAAIERVEVLPSGASATYGADAVAGVVNVILRENFEGAEFSISHSNTTADSDEGRYNANFVFGNVGDRSNTLFLVDYYKRNAFFDRDRAFSVNSVRPSQQGIYPSFNDLFWNDYLAGDDIDGVIQSAGGDTTESPAIGGCPAEQFDAGRFGQFCEVNTNQFSSIDDEYESIGAVLTHNVDINNSLRWFNEVMYQQYTSKGVASPANFSGVDVSDIHPNWTPEFQQELVNRGIANGGAIDFNDYLGFPVLAWGKFPDARGIENESESYRVVTGLEGKVSSWDWEVGISYGENSADSKGISGLYKRAEFEAALIGEICTDGTFTADSGSSCGDQGKETLWYNPFGGQTEQMAEVDTIIRTEANRSGKSKMAAIDGVFSGGIVDLPAGELKMAFGIEYRREEVIDTPSDDAIATVDDPEPILGFSSTSADYSRNQYAVFTEAFIPLADSLSVQLSARYDDYEDFGGDLNPKIGFRYQPNAHLIFRGNWSTSFRAPSLAQSGAGTLLSSYTIDCADVPEACAGDATAEGNALLSEDIGNPELQPEEATTSGFGFVFKTESNFDMSVDYWQIEHENLIGIDEDDFLRRALSGAFPVVGDGALTTGMPGVEQDAGGFVSDAHFPLTNLGNQETSGVDIALTHYFEPTSLGNFSALFDATYLIEFDRQASEASEVEHLAGDFRYPRWLANAKLRWSHNAWSASIAANYTHGYKDDPSFRTLEALGLDPDAEVDVGSWTVWDLSVIYDFENDSFIKFNIDNIFDRNPPRVLGTGANVDHINHDAYGAVVKLAYTHVF